MIDTWTLTPLQGPPTIEMRAGYKCMVWKGVTSIGHVYDIWWEILGDSKRDGHYVCLKCGTDNGYGGLLLMRGERCCYCGSTIVAKVIDVVDVVDVVDGIDA